MIRDALGSEFSFDAPPRRVVSLVPSITESLFAIGAGESVVAATEFCLFPKEELAGVPRVGGTKNPKIDAIRALNPDLVHMNLEENLKRHADAIAEFAPVFVTEPKSPRDVIDVMEALGEIHGREREAASVVDAIRRELDQPKLASFTFAVPIWKDPWMWCGGDTYVSALVEAVGGRNVLAEERRYPEHSVADIIALRPDVVFLPDEPFEFSSVEREVLQTFGSFDIVGPFPGDLFTWHGSRTVRGLRFLREVLQQIGRG